MLKHKAATVLDRLLCCTSVSSTKLQVFDCSTDYKLRHENGDNNYEDSKSLLIMPSLTFDEGDEDGVMDPDPKERDNRNVQVSTKTESSSKPAIPVGPPTTSDLTPVMANGRQCIKVQLHTTNNQKAQGQAPPLPPLPLTGSSPTLPPPPHGHKAGSGFLVLDGSKNSAAPVSAPALTEHKKKRPAGSTNGITHRSPVSSSRSSSRPKVSRTDTDSTASTSTAVADPSSQARALALMKNPSSLLWPRFYQTPQTATTPPPTKNTSFLPRCAPTRMPFEKSSSMSTHVGCVGTPSRNDDEARRLELIGKLQAGLDLAAIKNQSIEKYRC
ncbi:hypothetical protein ACA910_014888 [Epithemia clementina (nom. ined.)]